MYGIDTQGKRGANTNISQIQKNYTMTPLNDILNACSSALKQRSSTGSPAWLADYAAVVDPESILEMAIIIRSLLEYIDTKEGENIVTEAIRKRLCGPDAGTSTFHNPPVQTHVKSADY